MKATGMIRRIDELGRICLPKEMRKSLGIVEGTPLEFFVDGNQIVMKKCGNNITQTLSALEEQLEDMYVELGPEKTESIRKNIRDIRLSLEE